MRYVRVMLAAIAAVLAIEVSSAADDVVKQIQLTEKQVLAFIAGQKEMAAILEKLEGEAQDNPPPAVRGQLETTAKKHGFKDFQEYDDVSANIFLVMAGIDPQTKKFTEPAVAIKKEIAQVTADKKLSAQEKKQTLEELNEALASAQPIQFPGNVELVRKYYDKIDASLS
jgi:homoserine dehydrogenase